MSKIECTIHLECLQLCMQLIRMCKILGGGDANVIISHPQWDLSNLKLIGAAVFHLYLARLKGGCKLAQRYTQMAALWRKGGLSNDRRWQRETIFSYACVNVFRLSEIKRVETHPLSIRAISELLGDLRADLQPGDRKGATSFMEKLPAPPHFLASGSIQRIKAVSAGASQHSFLVCLHGDSHHSFK